jgi:hypothetical protein
MRMPMPRTFLSSGDVRSSDPLSGDLMILTAPQSRAALSEARYYVRKELRLPRSAFRAGIDHNWSPTAQLLGPIPRNQCWGMTQACVFHAEQKQFPSQAAKNDPIGRQGDARKHFKA